MEVFLQVLLLWLVLAQVLPEQEQPGTVLCLQEHLHHMDDSIVQNAQRRMLVHQHLLQTFP
jgi:hypothetical protein